jgi:hypothetical protein
MPEVGQSLSHYSLVEKIGKGGRGELFRAKDRELGRNASIKVLAARLLMNTGNRGIMQPVAAFEERKEKTCEQEA